MIHLEKLRFLGVSTIEALFYVVICERFSATSPPTYAMI